MSGARQTAGQVPPTLMSLARASPMMLAAASLLAAAMIRFRVARSRSVTGRTTDKNSARMGAP